MPSYAGGSAGPLNATNAGAYMDGLERDLRHYLRGIPVARPGDVVVYTPQYLNTVIAYYGSHLRAHPLDTGLPKRHHSGRVFLLASFQDKAPYRLQAHKSLLALRHQGRRLITTLHRPQIRVWELSR